MLRPPASFKCRTIFTLHRLHQPANAVSLLLYEEILRIFTFFERKLCRTTTSHHRGQHSDPRQQAAEPIYPIYPSRYSVQLPHRVQKSFNPSPTHSHRNVDPFIAKIPFTRLSRIFEGLAMPVCRCDLPYDGRCRERDGQRSAVRLLGSSTWHRP